jgi:hypothetical protein
MASKCLPEYLLIRPQPSTLTGRGLSVESRGLVDTSVEGRILLIRFFKAGNKGLGRGCRYCFSNCSKEKAEFRSKERRKAYRDNKRAKCLHPLLLQLPDWPQWRAA